MLEREEVYTIRALSCEEILARGDVWFHARPWSLLSLSNEYDYS